MGREAILTVENMYKSFGITKALVNVSLELRRGEIRGLIGENGSGKSTVSSIVAGVQKCDDGKMMYLGKQYKPDNMVDAQSQGVSMVVQEMGTIPGIRVADNIFIGKEARFKKGMTVRRKAMYAEAKKILTKIGIHDIEPDCSIDTLNFEAKKLVEIARAMYDEPEILIIDETTTALSQRGRDIVYKIMKQLQKENKSVLFISHDLDELMQVCDAITVLRDGHIIDTLTREQMDVDVMRSLMVGRELEGDYYRSDYDGSYSDEVVMEVNRVTAKTVLENFSLELHRGEILGIGGLSDCGMHELGRIMFGVEKTLTGYVKLMKDNVEITDPRVAINHKIGYVSKNRDQEALMLQASINDNVVLPSLDIIKKFETITKKNEHKLTEKQIEVMSIKCTGPEQLVSDLSGGNKQKVVFGKWLGNESDILILDCPTRGIDVGVKAAMYQLIYRFKKEGKAIVMISEEMSELIGMSDRILIIKDGLLSGAFTRSKKLSEMDIIKTMI